jgi:hypothetical protein
MSELTWLRVSLTAMAPAKALSLTGSTHAPNNPLFQDPVRQVRRSASLLRAPHQEANERDQRHDDQCDAGHAGVHFAFGLP